MSTSRDATIFIDLEFLSPEEEAVIRQVLLRDEVLKQQELGRVRKLRESVSDRKELKVLSGEWFDDLRSKRYGRQPDISAVVRSSMRWKKTAGHRPNPFLNAVLEEKDDEEDRTCPNVSADPRSIHPALSAEVYREYKDEDFALEVEAPSGQSPAKNIPLEQQNIFKVTNPIHIAANPGTQSAGKPKDVSQDKAPLIPSPKPEPVLQPKSTGVFTKNVKTNAEDGETKRKVSLPPALEKDQSFEENWVKISLESNTVQPSGPKTTVGEDVPVKTLEVTSFSQSQKASGQDQLGNNADSSKTKLKFEAGKIIHPGKTTEIEVRHLGHPKKELVMRKDGSGFEEVSPSRSLPGEPKKEDEMHPVSLQGPNRGAEITASSTEMMKMLQSKSNPAPQMEKEIIKATDIKRSSPTRMEVLSVNVESGPGVHLDKKTEPAHDPNRPKDIGSDQNMLWEMKRDKFAERVMKNAGPAGRRDFDVEFVGSESADKIAPRVAEQTDQKATAGEAGDAGQTVSDISTEDLKKESDILASVYARALKPRSPVPKNVFPQEPKRVRIEEPIPTIVIARSDSEGPHTTESENSGTASPQAPVEVPRPVTPSFNPDTWEDEGVDSDDDSTSVSSYGSDLSGRRGFSTSTLSAAGRTGSLLSVYSDAGDFGNVTVQGAVEFALMYSPLGELVIMVEQCQDLAIANARKQRTDPYVKTYLYPDKRSKRKTSIKKRTVNPVYVESLRYKVKREELPGKTLNLSVWHNDSRGRNVFLGQVEINLRNWDWKHEALTWYDLQPKDADNQDLQEYYGQLSLSLKYVPPESTGSKASPGEIHVWLREARQLRRLKPQGVDSFVKCYMLPDTSKKSRQKTRVVKKSLNPVYNHSMVYEGFRPGEVREACCELTVWDNNKLSNQFLGGVRLGLGTGQSYGKKVDWMDSVNEEIEIWDKMLANPDKWVEADLPLRSSMTPRK